MKASKLLEGLIQDNVVDKYCIEQAIKSKEKKDAALKSMVETTVNTGVNGLIIYGTAGNQKGETVVNTLMELGKEPIVAPLENKAITTYLLLYDNPSRTIVVDDSACQMSAKNLLYYKAALWSRLDDGKRVVVWQGSEKQLPVRTVGEVEAQIESQVSFTGRVILVLNVAKLPDREHIRAMESRVLSYCYDLTYNEKVIALLEAVEAPEKLDLTREQAEALVRHILIHAKPDASQFDLRLLQKSASIMKQFPDNWESVVEAIVDGDPRYFLLKNLYQVNCTNEERAALFKSFGEEQGLTGCKRSTFFTLQRSWFKGGAPQNLTEKECIDRLIKLDLRKGSTNGNGHNAGNGTKPGTSAPKNTSEPEAPKSKSPATSEDEKSRTKKGTLHAIKSKEKPEASVSRQDDEGEGETEKE